MTTRFANAVVRMLILIYSPSPKPWSVLSNGAPICITPRDMHTKICITRKENAATIYQSMLYDMVIFGLADIANITVAYHGDPDFPTSPEVNMTGFATNHPPSLLQLSIVPVTGLFSLPVSAAAEFLVGLQALTYYLAVQEMTFGIFDVTSGEPNPVATWCLAFDCAGFGQNLLRPFQDHSVITNSSLSTTQLARLPTQSSSNVASRGSQDTELGLYISYTTVPTAEPVLVQSYVDVASDTIWQIIGAIIASHGDALMPPWTIDSNHEYGIVVGDRWGSGLWVMIVQDHDAYENLTLGLAAGALKLTMRAIVDEQLFVETGLQIGVIDSSGLAWPLGGKGCFRYASKSGGAGGSACPGFDGTTVGNGSSASSGNGSAFPLMLPAGYSSVSSTSALPVSSAASFDPNATS